MLLPTAFFSLLMLLPSGSAMSQCQVSIVLQITNYFENSQLAPAYGYCENINDGRGFTAGIVGFTTATADALQVIERYQQKTGNNEFQFHMNALRQCARTESGNTWKLIGFCLVWKFAALKASFRHAQMDVMQEEYWNPAMNLAERIGLVMPVSLGQMYDSAIQHGMGDDHDSLGSMVQRVTVRAPFQGGSEEMWLRNFLDVRRRTLSHAADPDTREAWAESVTRIDTYSGILNRNAWFTGDEVWIDHSGDGMLVKCDLSVMN